ncbi:hypothetical protein V7S43_010741 [Phytophthora oleae]|uniref:RxLR effector protein n=1 Tax=Phytophthora oleae TaxID=2107226 RepID=A0ABD3FCB7_9STRA
MPNLEKLKSLTGLERQKSLSNTMSKLEDRSVSKAELIKMRKFADQDLDLIKIKPLGHELTLSN